MGSGARTDYRHRRPTTGSGVDVTVLEGAHVVTVDGSGSEFAGGHVVVTGNRITAVGPGAAPAIPAGAADHGSMPADA